MLVRSALTFVLSVVCSLALAQDKLLTYTTPAIPLSVALDDLSKQAGEKLAVSNELANEPVVLRLNGVPLQEALDRIATEFVAAWTPTKDGLQLSRTDDVVNAFEQKWRADRIAALRKGIQGLSPILSSPDLTKDSVATLASNFSKLISSDESGAQGNATYQDREKLDNQTPDMKLFAQLVTAIGAEKLADIPPGRQVFSLQPTPMELPIENVDAQAVDQYLDQHNLLANALVPLLPKHSPYADDYVLFWPRMNVNRPARPLIAVDGDYKTDGMYVNLSIYGPDGKTVGGDQLKIGNLLQDGDYAREKEKADNGSRNESGIALSPEEAEIASRYSSESFAGIPLSAGSIALLSDPEHHDPLSVGFSTMLLEDAKRENRNLIASVSDDDYRLPRSIGTNHFTASEYEFILELSKRVNIDRPDGWLIVDSNDPISATKNRIDREGLGNLARAYAEKGYASLEDWAAMAQHIAPHNDGAMAYNYWNVLRGVWAMTYQNNWDALRLYGSLSQDQSNQLSAGQAVSFRVLSQEQQDCLTRLVYEGDNLFQRPQNPSSKVDEQTGYVPGIDSEPTECVPNGVPADAQLTARVDNDQIMTVRYGQRGYETDWDTNLNDLAGLLVQLQDGPPMSIDFVVDGIRLGSKRTVTFDLSLTDKVLMEVQLREDHFDKSGMIAVKDLQAKLPPDMWKKLTDQMAAVRADRKKYPQMDSDGPPPPAAPPLHY